MTHKLARERTGSRWLLYLNTTYMSTRDNQTELERTISFTVAAAQQMHQMDEFFHDI